ncbi:MAG: M3 family oligoendopeptidase [Candidatus Binatia bacterium]
MDLPLAGRHHPAMVDGERSRAGGGGRMRWDLGELYRDAKDPRLKEDLARAAREAAELAARLRGRIERAEIAPEELAEALLAYEAILETGTRPGFYASLLVAADTQSSDALALEQWAMEAWSEVQNELVFLELEIQQMPEEALRRLLEHPAIAPVRHYLERCRRHRAHALPEPEEKLLNRKELTSRAAFVQLHDELCGSLRFEVEIDGEERVLTDAETLALLHRPERDVRRHALERFLDTYRRHELVLTSVFNNLLLDHRIETELRRFPSTIAPRHLDNDIEPETVEAMMDAVDRHYPDVQEYLRLKAQLLELPDMSVSDVYAPLGVAPEEVPFHRARELVLQSFGSFSSRFAELARDFFDRGWIDAEVRPGKRGGAFCASHGPAHHPYVLASYTGTARDVSTLAHELGHGVHARLASRQRLLVFEAPLVLAETASVFGEMLLAERLLRDAASDAARARILCDALDEVYGTIFRQNALTRFEIAAHRARRDTRLSAEALGELWLESQRALFGEAVALPEIYRFGWIYIPHFVHLPFYCYSYSFGHLLVLALLERHREEGPSFVPGFLRILEGGGSDSPARLLRAIGIELAAPELWETAFRAIRRMIAELRRVTETRTA